jgi:hypothetical protein
LHRTSMDAACRRPSPPASRPLAGGLFGMSDGISDARIP